MPWGFAHCLYVEISCLILEISKAKLTCEVHPSPPGSFNRILVGKTKNELAVDELSKGSGYDRDADVQFVFSGVVSPAGHSLG